jgi:hypothetical protein
VRKERTQYIGALPILQYNNILIAKITRRP